MTDHTSNAEVLAEASNWPSSRLGGIVDVLDSKRKPIAKRDRVSGPHPYYGATGVLDWVEGHLFDEPLVLVGEDGAKWGPGDNSAFGISGKTWVNNHAHVLRPRRDYIIDEWLIYYLNAADLSEFISGMTVPKLNQGRLRDIPIPLPPVKEQKRIVAVLKQAFAALDRARAHSEANRADAEELFGNWIASLFNPQGASDEEITTIGDVCRIQSGAGFPMKEQGRTEGLYPFYKVSDMNLAGNERLLLRANNYIDEAARKRLRASVFPNASIVFPKVGGAISTNKKRVVEVEGCVDNNVMGLIADERRILPEYLHEWLHAVDIFEFSNKANPPSITQSTVSGWPLRVPRRDEQSATVTAIENMRTSIKQMQKSYSHTSADIVELRQLLLQRAFSGGLI